MKQGAFNIHEKGYPEQFHNTDLFYNQGETVAEIVAAGHAENEAAVVRAFYGQFNIRASAGLKKMVKDGTATIESMTAYLQGYKVLAEKQQGGGGGNPEALAKARESREANKAKAAAMDEIKAKAEADPEVAKQIERLRKLGVNIPL